MKEHCCIICNKKTVSVINTEEGPVCYNCYSDKKNPPKQKQHHDNEEARIQSEFFSKVPSDTEKGICFSLSRVQDIYR